MGGNDNQGQHGTGSGQEYSILKEVFGSHRVVLPVGYGNSGPGGPVTEEDDDE